MNNDELIKRLQLLNEVDCNVAADRIEALQKEVERNAAIAIRAMERATLAEQWTDHYKARADLMTELVDALSLILAWHDKDKYASGKMTFERSGAFGKARAALAKIKEQQA